MMITVTQAHSPHRLELETCAVAGTLETQGMDGPRRPPLMAFERHEPDTPVKVPPLPRPQRKSKAPRWLCVQCGQAADDPEDLCEPMPMGAMR